MVDSYACVCPVDYTGVHCEIQIDDCNDVDCGNGTCQDMVAGYTCLCLTGYTGNNSETVNLKTVKICNGKRQLILSNTWYFNMNALISPSIVIGTIIGIFNKCNY